MEERHPTAPRLGRGEPPAHAGLTPTFCGCPLVLDPAELSGVDVAVVGAPFDDGTSNRPGVVVVCPPFDRSRITALAAERAALDILTGMAMRRGGA